jgi:uncharacterized membrane protein
MNARAFPARTVISILAVVGALACVGLELIHYRAYMAPASDSFCAIGEHLDCRSVALSKYAVLVGVPLPVWGFAGYVAILVAARLRSRWTLPLALVATLAGVGLSAASAFGIGAWCWVCEATHLVSLAILVSAWRGRAAFDVPLLSRAPASRESAALALLPALGLLVAAYFFLPRYWAVFTWRSVLPFASGKTDDGHSWIGAEHPTLTLEEFVDYSCPHCKAASARSLARIAEHPDELRIVRRHYPLTLCQVRSEKHCLPLRIALCADDQGRFWQADRWLFDHSQGGQEPDVAEAARDLGLDAERLASCVRSDAAFDRAIAEWRQAKKLRIPGTPYYRREDRIISAASASQLLDAL